MLNFHVDTKEIPSSADALIDTAEKAGYKTRIYDNHNYKVKGFYFWVDTLYSEQTYTDTKLPKCIEQFTIGQAIKYFEDHPNKKEEKNTVPLDLELALKQIQDLIKEKGLLKDERFKLYERNKNNILIRENYARQIKELESKVKDLVEANDILSKNFIDLKKGYNVMVDNMNHISINLQSFIPLKFDDNETSGVLWKILS